MMEIPASRWRGGDLCCEEKLFWNGDKQLYKQRNPVERFFADQGDLTPPYFVYGRENQHGAAEKAPAFFFHRNF
ncbi:MAG: hypothetical protein HFG13_08070 [Oscillibacter sp.]|nr:hypothetical protein [Oscillibacter sp.]